MGLAALAADYLFIGPLIRERLLDKVPELPCEVAERPEQVLEADKRARVLVVMWAGDRFAEAAGGRAGNGASQIVHQRWLVAFAINNVGKAKDARQKDAGEVLSQVHKALAGWVPEGAVNSLLRANAPLQPLFTESKAVYPLGFEISLTL